MELFFENKEYGITGSGIYENSEILEASKKTSKSKEKAESFSDVINIISTNKKKAEKLLLELEGEVKNSNNSNVFDYLLDADANNVENVNGMDEFKLLGQLNSTK